MYLFVVVLPGKVSEPFPERPDDTVPLLLFAAYELVNKQDLIKYGQDFGREQKRDVESP